MLLTRQTSAGKWQVRPDGAGKVTGKLKFLTDMDAPDMLVGRVLRSPHPHARILSIHTELAEQVQGVHAVITHKDVPGLNGFGITHPDHPVFCEDRVRYVGDAVAAVAADSEEIADYALGLIKVEYEELPVLEDPELAMHIDAEKLHPDGNILHRTDYKIGQVEMGFAQSFFIVEETYITPRQMHTYMETEGGLFIPEPDGRITVYAPTQHGYMDQMQLSRILAIPKESIRVVSSPIGGSFGGKDELNVQPAGCLLALKSGRPVKMHNSRWESVRAGVKRHPMKLTMKTGMDQEGRILAHQVRIIADTGAYSTLGVEVLNFATEHVMGPYRMANIDVEGVSVFTNNGVSGEFRGFGGNQAIFALEGQLDRLAEKTGIDPWVIRLINLRKKDDQGPFGQQIAQTDGAFQVWEALNGSDIWQNKLSPQTTQTTQGSLPWIRHGVGAAIVMHGAGLGVGIPDPAGGRLTLTREGKIEAAFGYEEFGQGLISSLEIMLKEHFNCTADDLDIVIGDTDRVPQSGSSTASRATSMLWMALQRLKPPFEAKLLEAASLLTAKPVDQLKTGPCGIWLKSANLEEPLITYKILAEKGTQELSCDTEFNYPTSPDSIVGGHFLYTYAAVAVRVEVNILTGRVKVLDQFHSIAAGPVINPQGFLGQIEGGSVMALGFAITEEAIMEAGHYMTRNLDTYLIPTISDIHAHFEVDAIEDLPEEDVFGPRGVGEIGTVGLAPAIASAIHQAVGMRVNKLPISPEQLQQSFILGREGAGFR